MPAVDPNDFLAQILAEKTSIAGGFPMSQEEFQHEVTKRMDRGKDVQKVYASNSALTVLLRVFKKVFSLLLLCAACNNVANKNLRLSVT
jgi:hypothetical protein